MKSIWILRITTIRNMYTIQFGHPQWQILNGIKYYSCQRHQYQHQRQHHYCFHPYMYNNNNKLYIIIIKDNYHQSRNHNHHLLSSIPKNLFYYHLFQQKQKLHFKIGLYDEKIQYGEVDTRYTNIKIILIIKY